MSNRANYLPCLEKMYYQQQKDNIWVFESKHFINRYYTVGKCTS